MNDIRDKIEVNTYNTDQCINWNEPSVYPVKKTTKNMIQ